MPGKRRFERLSAARRTMENRILLFFKQSRKYSDAENRNRINNWIDDFHKLDRERIGERIGRFLSGNFLPEAGRGMLAEACRARCAALGIGNCALDASGSLVEKDSRKFFRIDATVALPFSDLGKFFEGMPGSVHETAMGMLAGKKAGLSKTGLSASEAENWLHNNDAFFILDLKEHKKERFRKGCFESMESAFSACLPSDSEDSLIHAGICACGGRWRSPEKLVSMQKAVGVANAGLGKEIVKRICEKGLRIRIGLSAARLIAIILAACMIPLIFPGFLGKLAFGCLGAWAGLAMFSGWRDFQEGIADIDALADEICEEYERMIGNEEDAD